MAMEIEDQEKTYAAFTRWTVRSVVACVVVLALMALFLV